MGTPCCGDVCTFMNTSQDNEKSERVDVLGKTRRGRIFNRGILSPVADGELQAIVEQAAADLETPIALVSFVLDNVQLFRAHVGLPAELACSRGTDRDLSFCQFVVDREEAFTVEDAREDARVPQGLVGRHAVVAYLGTPIRLDGEVLGSLCVIDSRPRIFEARHLERLEELARRVDRRLIELTSTKRLSRHLGDVSSMAFAEVRNLLSPMVCQVDVLESALAELAPLVRLSQQRELDPESFEILRRAGLAFEDLEVEVREIGPRLERLVRHLEAIQEMISSDGTSGRLEDAIQGALELSHHMTKLIGGVRITAQLDDSVRLRAQVHTTRAVLALALNMMADALFERGMEGGIALEPRVEPEYIELRLRAQGLKAADYAKLREELGERAARGAWRIDASEAADEELRLRLLRS